MGRPSQSRASHAQKRPTRSGGKRGCKLAKADAGLTRSHPGAGLRQQPDTFAARSRHSETAPSAGGLLASLALRESRHSATTARRIGRPMNHGDRSRKRLIHLGDVSPDGVESRRQPPEGARPKSVVFQVAC